jgi:hypothetical protein
MYPATPVVSPTFREHRRALAKGMRSPTGRDRPGASVSLAASTAFRLVAAGLRIGVIGGKRGLGSYVYQKRYYLGTRTACAGLVTIVLIGLAVS